MEKADDEYDFEDGDEKAKYTNFELLQAKVKVLQEQLELHAKILKQNNMTEVKTDYDLTADLDDETFKHLET